MLDMLGLWTFVLLSVNLQGQMFVLCLLPSWNRHGSALNDNILISHTHTSHLHGSDKTRGRGGELHIGIHRSCGQPFEGAGAVGQLQISTVRTLTP
ncbi:hypothetical protein C8Q74DRAFT_706522 [Fomes fomentarius]|nr:hypothetical protein C8Q74DRAFT_706522 [Fomes fomentarius]